MKNKIMKIISTVALLVTVGIMMFTGSRIKPNINLNDVYVPEVVVTPQPEIVDKPEQVKPEVETPTFVFDTYIPREWNSDDYADSKDEVVYVPESTRFCTSYTFSNGFVIKDTDNLSTKSASDEFAYFSSIADESALIAVYEVNPLSNSIHELRETSISSHGFNYYLKCSPLGIPVDVDEEYLLKDYSQYFELKDFASNPLESGIYQLLTDNITKTAFGNALYVEYKNTSTNTYTAEAYILCDRDRIICIEMSADSREYFYEYLIELTNKGITLIK